MKSVRVRIALAIDHDGDWAASGWRVRSSGDDETCMDTAIGSLDTDHGATYWIEADIPVPAVRDNAPVIEGEVLPA